MNSSKKNLFESIANAIKAYFLHGLLLLLPLALTFAILNVSFGYFRHWLKPIYNLEPEYLHKIPYSEFLVTLLFIFIIGALFKIFLLDTLVHAFEAVLLKIPLLNPIYSGIKQLVHAFTAQDKLSFQRAVLIEFPRSGVYSVGFITSEVPAHISPNSDKNYVTVFIPTTPNPTTGFFIFALIEDIIDTNLTRQEAMTLVISGGIVKPTRFMETKK